MLRFKVSGPSMPLRRRCVLQGAGSCYAAKHCSASVFAGALDSHPVFPVREGRIRETSIIPGYGKYLAVKSGTAQAILLTSNLGYHGLSLVQVDCLKHSRNHKK